MTVQLTPAARSRAVAFIFVTVLLDMIGFGLIIPVLPSLIEDVGRIDLADAALIGGGMFAAFSIAQFLFGPVMGNLSDAYGRRPLLLLAVAGLAVDYLCSALAPNLAWLFVGRIVAGVCGASYVIANAFIADITEAEERAKYFGLMGAAFGVGFVIGPAIGGLLGEFGPRVPFWVAAGISAANFIFGWFVMPETLPREKRRPFDWRRSNPFGAFKIFRQYGAVLPLAGVLGLYFFASSVYPAIWPFWGQAQFGWSTWTVGVTLAVFGLIAAITQGALSGPLVKRFGEQQVALWGMVTAVISCIGYGAAGSLTVVVILMLVHAPEGLVNPMIAAIMSKAVPDDAQGELQGGLASVGNLAMLLGTLFYTAIFSWSVRAEGAFHLPGLAFYVAGGVLAGTLLLFLSVARARPAAAE
jgi:MFS transporter, DHA1 family, tetracycline resistance protein